VAPAPRLAVARARRLRLGARQEAGLHRRLRSRDRSLGRTTDRFGPSGRAAAAARPRCRNHRLRDVPDQRCDGGVDGRLFRSRSGPDPGVRAASPVRAAGAGRRRPSAGRARVSSSSRRESRRDYRGLAAAGPAGTGHGHRRSNFDWRCAGPGRGRSISPGGDSRRPRPRAPDRALEQRQSGWGQERRPPYVVSSG
jgi:hypothetical protein